MGRRPIAVTCGDPAGIGLEITLGAAQQLAGSIPFVWFGDTSHLPQDLGWGAWVPDQAGQLHPTFSAYHIPFEARPQPGQGDPRNARGVIESIEVATKFAMSGKVSGLCTAPIHKALLQDGANFQFPGHTEFLAHLAGVENVVMMLACDELRVVPLTIHIPISDVPSAITKELFDATLHLTHGALRRDFGIADPIIWIAGLNPHASEGGKIGREDIDLIGPWITQAQKDGINVSGPFSADTMFHAKARVQYDAAICMYHDQALIPIKTIDFSGGVNVTLGLPFPRTSPDHGTAFDIAGKGMADANSMIAALKMAQTMAQARDAN